MDFWHTWSGHSVILAVVIILSLFAVYYLFKQFVKFILLLILILLLMGGYFYFKNPTGSPRTVGQVLKDTGTQVNKAVKNSKNVYQKGKNVYRRGKEVTETIDEVFGDEKEAPANK